MRILYVEDEVLVLNVLTRLLKMQGFEVDSAKNGAEGLNLYEKSDYDLVITDLAMPELDGFELIKNVKSNFENQKIFVTTAYREEAERIKNMVDEIYLKPVDIHDIIKGINQLAV